MFFPEGLADPGDLARDRVGGIRPTFCPPHRGSHGEPRGRRPNPATRRPWYGLGVMTTTTTSNAVDRLIGQTFGGRFTIERLVGSGGMGLVYSAVDATTKERVALKVLNPDYRTDAAIESRFLREMRLATHLDHPNIEKVLGHGVDNGRLYLALEMVQGCTLDELIADEAPFDPVRTVWIGMQLAQALAAMHEAAVVHRDLQPANVMLESRNGEQKVVKIIDFGIALAYRSLGEDDDNSKRFTAGGSRVGTPGFMSPEYLCSATVLPSSDPLCQRE